MPFKECHNKLWDKAPKIWECRWVRINSWEEVINKEVEELEEVEVVRVIKIEEVRWDNSRCLTSNNNNNSNIHLKTNKTWWDSQDNNNKQCKNLYHKDITNNNNLTLVCNKDLRCKHLYKFKFLKLIFNNLLTLKIRRPSLEMLYIHKYLVYLESHMLVRSQVCYLMRMLLVLRTCWLINNIYLKKWQRLTILSSRHFNSKVNLKDKPKFNSEYDEVKGFIN